MTVRETLIITIYGDNSRAPEALRQVENYAQSLPGVAVKTEKLNERPLEKRVA